MKNDPVESALARLDEIPLRTSEGKAAFAKALAAKSNLVVAKAARLLGINRTRIYRKFQETGTTHE